MNRNQSAQGERSRGIYAGVTELIGHLPDTVGLPASSACDLAVITINHRIGEVFAAISAITRFIRFLGNYLVLPATVRIGPGDCPSVRRMLKNLPDTALVNLVHGLADVAANDHTENAAANDRRSFSVAPANLRPDRCASCPAQNLAQHFSIASPLRNAIRHNIHRL